MSNRAVVYRDAGSIDVIGMEERPMPQVGPDEVLVEIHAVGLNRADILQRKGFYPAPEGVPADIPGLEFAGVVQSTGERVMSIVGGGAMSRFISVPKEHLIPIPDTYSFEQAAAIPEAYLTAFDALIRGEIQAGKTVLVHAGASGVGSAAIQLAKFVGAHVWATTRSEKKADYIRSLGAEPIIVNDAKFAEAAGTSMDIILDSVGASYLDENLRTLAYCGRIVSFGLLGGAKGEINLGKLLAKRARIEGTVLRSRSNEEKSALIADFKGLVMPALNADKIGMHIDEIFEMSALNEAQEYMENNLSMGKIVLRW